jgi:hypothetical protein
MVQIFNFVIPSISKLDFRLFSIRKKLRISIDSPQIRYSSDTKEFLKATGTHYDSNWFSESCKKLYEEICKENCQPR